MNEVPEEIDNEAEEEEWDGEIDRDSRTPPVRGRLEGNVRREEEEREGVLIARGASASLFEFAHLYVASFEADGFQVPVTILQGTMHETALLMARGDAELWGAWWRPQVLGPPMGMVEIRRAWGAPFGKHYQVARLYVRQAFRHKGVARALLSEALLSLPDADAPVLFMVAKEQLPRSYRRLGARTYGVLGVGSLADAQAVLRR